MQLLLEVDALYWFYVLSQIWCLGELPSCCNWKTKQTAFKPKETTYYSQDYVFVFMMSIFAQLFKKFKHFCYYSEILKIVFLKKFYTASLKNKDCTGWVEDAVHETLSDLQIWLPERKTRSDWKLELVGQKYSSEMSTSVYKPLQMVATVSDKWTQDSCFVLLRIVMDALCFIFLIDSDCDSDDDPAYIPDTDSDDTEPESSGTQHTTRKSVVKFGSALSTAGMLC